MSVFSRISTVLVFGSLATGLNAQSPFTEEGLARGLAYFNQDQLWSFHGFGVLLCDLDDDGAPDALGIGGFLDMPGLFKNNGSGFFTDVTASSGLNPLEKASASLAFDYDADGDLDLYIASFGGHNALVRNDGELTFTDVANDLGVNHIGNGGGGSAADVDGNGWMDLHVPNYGQPDLFYDNEGGTFTERAVEFGLADPWRGLESIFFDMDRDGDMDLYVSNDKKDGQNTTMHNRLYENRDGVLVDVSVGSGTDVNIWSMGVAVGDFSGDGLPDLYATNLPDEPNPLMINIGNGRFVERTDFYGTQSFRLGWGATFFDFDNDTFNELYVLNSLDTDPRNRLYTTGGSETAVDIASLVGLDSHLNSYTSAVADIDNDGDVDILTGETNNWLQLYVNREGTNKNWVKLRIHGHGKNHFAVGTEVTVRTAERVQRSQVLVGCNGFKSMNDLTLHYGLGDAKRIEEIIVRRPGGAVQRFGDVAVNRTYAIFPRIARQMNPRNTTLTEIRVP